MRVHQMVLIALLLFLGAACSDAALEPIGPAEELTDFHHQPGHRGAPGGGDGDGEDRVRYEVQVIDTDGTHAGNSLAYGIDEEGAVVGLARLSFENHGPRAFHWAEGFSDLQSLPALDPAMNSEAVAIHSGLVVGWQAADRDRTPFLYELGSQTRQDLDHLERDDCIDGYSSRPVAVAAWGIAGTSSCMVLSPDGSTARSTRPVVWLAADGYRPHELPLQDGDGSVFIRDVNDTGTVLGQLTRNGSGMVITWTVSGPGQISGPQQRYSSSIGGVFALNNTGDMVGLVGVRAELVTESGAAVSLERVHNRDGSILATDLTDRVDGIVRVVGHSGFRAALWTVDAAEGKVLSAEYLDFPDGHYWQARATAINAAGAIAGYSITRSSRGEDSRQRATVWLPNR